MKIEGSTALLLGYGTLCAGAAQELLKGGVAKLVIANRQQGKSEKNAEQLRQQAKELGLSVEVIALALDVAPDPNQTSEIAPVTIDDFLVNLEAAQIGEIDLLLLASGGNRGEANFGLRKTEDPEELPWDSWDRDAMHSVYQANCQGPTELLYKLGSRLSAQTKSPTVIVVGSVSPLLSGVNHYAASKVALMEEVKRYRIYLSQARALSHPEAEAPCVCPIIWGFTESPQSTAMLYKDGVPTYRCAEILKATAAMRFGTVEEFGRTVAFIAETPYASTVIADGGFLSSLVV